MDIRKLSPTARRAISEVTRAEVHAVLRTLDGGFTVQQVAALTGGRAAATCYRHYTNHHNMIRVHLQELVEQGVLEKFATIPIVYQRKAGKEAGNAIIALSNLPEPLRESADSHRRFGA